uniref:Uncharacterized protein n=1 Tax=Uncultured archaeon GZfos26G2 TaxID=3386331 RepID=Q649W5_UNCAG|nr:hypothetical protein GZ34A6_23 [uncultured archaeon GZfos34A6]
MPSQKEIQKKSKTKSFYVIIVPLIFTSKRHGQNGNEEGGGVLKIGKASLHVCTYKILSRT